MASSATCSIQRQLTRTSPSEGTRPRATRPRRRSMPLPTVQERRRRTVHTAHTPCLHRFSTASSMRRNSGSRAWRPRFGWSGRPGCEPSAGLTKRATARSRLPSSSASTAAPRHAQGSQGRAGHRSRADPRARIHAKHQRRKAACIVHAPSLVGQLDEATTVQAAFRNHALSSVFGNCRILHAWRTQPQKLSGNRNSPPKRAGRAGREGTQMVTHITVHAAPEFHREYKLYAIENGLLMESFALFKKTRAGQEKRRAG